MSMFLSPVTYNLPGIQYYKWNGNLNVWNTPANTGQYEVSYSKPYTFGEV